MMFPGTEIFQKDIPEDIIDHYKEYVFHPMHLGMIKEKVLAGKFSSTREFLHETEWILHNCIIYNGGKHALTKIAKGIVKICKEDMREIELCPSCYGLTVKQPLDWFCIPCNPPHKVVLAKVRGYPLWPAKLISETSDKCDVRFFGQHDRSLVQRSSISALNGPPPAPATKSTHWSLAMSELTKYRQNINLMLKHIDSGKTPEEFIAEKMAVVPPKETPKELPKGPRKEKAEKKMSIQTHTSSPAPHTLHNGYNNESESRESSIAPSLSVSNHIPCSPQIVMVNPPLSESEETGTIHGNSASFAKSLNNSENYSEPSSPESDTLIIDVGEKRVAPSASKTMLKGKKSKRQDFYYNPQCGSSSMDVHLITPSPGYRPTQPGETLSYITNNLAKRAAIEQNDTSYSNDNNDEGDGMETAFSSIYPPDKTAIAVVDPNNKRTKRSKMDASPIKPSRKTGPKTRNNKKPDHLQPIPLVSYEGSTPLITGYEQSNGLLMNNTHQTIGADDDYPYGEGLLANTIKTIDQSYIARLDGMLGSHNDMGYQYFSEKLMSSIKTVVIEMLSIFESKGKAGAKQIKDHLHSAWPVPDSRSQLEKLRSQLKQEMTTSLEVVRTSAEMERQQVVSEVKRQAEVEKELAIQETKKKKWCSYCWKEAQYNCCWNANYCNESCQQSHWPEHMSLCTQIQQQQGMIPRTPGTLESQKILSPANIEGTMFHFNMGASQGMTDINEMGVVSGMNNQVDMPSLKSCGEFNGTSGGGALMDSPPPHSLNNDMDQPMEETDVVILTVPQEEMMPLTETEYTIETLPNYELMQQQQHSHHPPHHHHHHHPSAMVGHPPPPSPQHYPGVMMGHHPVSSIGLPHPQSTGNLSMPPPLPPPPGISLSLPSQSPHHNIMSHNLPLHAQPISPVTPPQPIDNQPHQHVSNTFSWPYQQPISALPHDLTHTLPLLPQVPAPTPTSQSNSFFRVFQ
jgi:hypothetical protein